MPCPHNQISIVQRSNRQSAVAAAAYQSGEKLFCEYDQEVKHYPEKRGIVHNEILLPANAPRSYADRNTLWNAAEAVEKQWNSQLARRWVLTIPREIPSDQYAVLVREFCKQQFVSKGMIVDFAIHDPHPPGHNPHAHVLLTMRAMDEHGKWLPKSRKVYDLDENGERIKLPSGRWKSHKEDTVDWDDQKYCEIWRHEWEVIQNRYLEANDRPERVDLRSYARQGLDIVPTVHEGVAVRQMEKRGIQTNIGNLNREIRAANSLMQSIRQLIHNLKGWITELGEKRKELLAQKAAEEATLLPNLLMKYMAIRKEERKDWTNSIPEDYVRNILGKRLFLCKGRYSRWDVNKVKAEYSYKDKCFLNVQIEKYGSNHLNDVLYTVYLLNISELLPEILTSISSCFTKAIRNSKEQFAKEIIDSQVIVDMIILKSFIFYSDEIKKDEKLINAYEDILLALTEIRNEKAAVLLDEFRIH